jgi:hypothetical protein
LHLWEPLHWFEQQSPLPPHIPNCPTQQLGPFPVGPHCWLLLQLLSAAQSLLNEQPHVPALHFGPGLHVAVHEVQAPPLVPHASSAVPAAHVPAVPPLPPLQQPPLHIVSLGPMQPAPQVCVLVLHASPALLPLAAGQSV